MLYGHWEVQVDIARLLYVYNVQRMIIASRLDRARATPSRSIDRVDLTSDLSHACTFEPDRSIDATFLKETIHIHNIGIGKLVRCAKRRETDRSGEDTEREQDPIF